MAELLLGPMLRFVDETSATIFVETDRACRVAVNAFETTTFAVDAHHYALVIAEGLDPGTTMEYQVRLDGVLCWPLPESPFPPSVIRTLGGRKRPLRLLFGSCRAAAPHHPPWSLSATEDPQGLGVDSLRAHGLRMVSQPSAEWPDLILFVGDQIYADEPSPTTLAHIRDRPNPRTLPEIAMGFADYALLYHEAWQPDVERWFLSVVPSTMIFDDHEVMDDWNISGSWVRDLRAKPWWQEHIAGALMSYWIYQHLGNLSPAIIREENMLLPLLSDADPEASLRAWATRSDLTPPSDGGYRFSYVRDFGTTRIVVIDCRNARVFEPERAMVGPEEWDWVDRNCRVECEHLFLVTSVPVLVTGGLHGLQSWNAALCDGAWGRLAAWSSEKLRRGLDLEDWPAFERSFIRMLQTISEIAGGTGRSQGMERPATICIVSGDIHFSYVAEATMPDRKDGDSKIYQLVSSPIRNTLDRRKRRVMRFAISPAGRAIGRFLHRSVRADVVDATWTLTHGPEFANELGALTIDGRSLKLMLERARPDENGNPILEQVIRTAL
jgi:hypothetical protein